MHNPSAVLKTKTHKKNGWLRIWISCLSGCSSNRQKPCFDCGKHFFVRVCVGTVAHKNIDLSRLAYASQLLNVEYGLIYIIWMCTSNNAELKWLSGETFDCLLHSCWFVVFNCFIFFSALRAAAIWRVDCQRLIGRFCISKIAATKCPQKHEFFQKQGACGLSFWWLCMCVRFVFLPFDVIQRRPIPSTVVLVKWN